MVTIDDVKGPKMSKGILLALMSAFFYASYLVLVKRKSDTEEKVDIPLFFGKFSLSLAANSITNDFNAIISIYA